MSDQLIVNNIANPYHEQYEVQSKAFRLYEYQFSYSQKHW